MHSTYLEGNLKLLELTVDKSSARSLSGLNFLK